MRRFLTSGPRLRTIVHLWAEFGRRGLRVPAPGRAHRREPSRRNPPTGPDYPATSRPASRRAVESGSRGGAGPARCNPMQSSGADTVARAQRARLAPQLVLDSPAMTAVRYGIGAFMVGAVLVSPHPQPRRPRRRAPLPCCRGRGDRWTPGPWHRLGPLGEFRATPYRGLPRSGSAPSRPAPQGW